MIGAAADAASNYVPHVLFGKLPKMGFWEECLVGNVFFYSFVVFLFVGNAFFDSFVNVSCDMLAFLL